MPFDEPTPKDSTLDCVYPHGAGVGGPPAWAQDRGGGDGGRDVGGGGGDGRNVGGGGDGGQHKKHQREKGGGGGGQGPGDFFVGDPDDFVGMGDPDNFVGMGTVVGFDAGVLINGMVCSDFLGDPDLFVCFDSPWLAGSPSWSADSEKTDKGSLCKSTGAPES